MRKVIYKQELSLGKTEVFFQLDAEFLYVATDPKVDMPCVWWSQNSPETPVENENCINSPLKRVVFRVFMTGETFDDKGLKYLQSFISNTGFVGHIYTEHS